MNFYKEYLNVPTPTQCNFLTCTNIPVIKFLRNYFQHLTGVERSSPSSPLVWCYGKRLAVSGVSLS